MSHKPELPRPLIEAFWVDVEKQVEQKGRLNAMESHGATARFRKKIAQKVGDMIYHENANEVARTIATGVFWDHVRNRLLERSGMAESAADRAIAAFVEFAEQHGFKKSILDHDQEDVARCIADGIKNGFREPASA